jgi:hypothetical protein
MLLENAVFGTRNVEESFEVRTPFYAIFSTTLQTALTGSHLSWRLCQKNYMTCYLFGTFSFIYMLSCTDMIVLGLIVGLPQPLFFLCFVLIYPFPFPLVAWGRKKTPKGNNVDFLLFFSLLSFSPLVFFFTHLKCSSTVC